MNEKICKFKHGWSWLRRAEATKNTLLASLNFHHEKQTFKTYRQNFLQILKFLQLISPVKF